ncbi:DNA-directed RNA polymerase subunit delta [Bacillus sp. FSL K6-3431]|uniref:DNA-directed RNA polymerase subunit delta n=1 Tax=Bacillus sp. FSL K6-3431 TaxID=2921500 RepID=UPI0030F988BA
MKLQQLSKEQRSEMSFIEVATYIFEEKREAMPFNELVAEIGRLLEIPEKKLRQRMLQFYTDINIDGQFISLGENRWGLREWYPFDQIDEEVIVPAKPKKKKAKKAAVIDDDEDLELEDDYDLDEDESVDDDDEDEEEEDESLEALREAEVDEDLVDDEFEIEEEVEELDIDEEDEDEEEEEEEEEQ